MTYSFVEPEHFTDEHQSFIERFSTFFDRVVGSPT